MKFLLLPVVISLLSLFSLISPTPTRAVNATMADYWAGNAEWKLRNSLTRTTSEWTNNNGFGGSHIEINNGIWYYFGTQIHRDENCAPPRDKLPKRGIEVRTSTDKGFTWSDPIEVVSPTDGTPWDCMATDGDIYYHSPTNTWHHLFQCITSSSDWQTCHLQKVGSSPVGAYTAPYPNPAVTAGTLWHQICNQSDDDCSKIVGGPRKVSDEGTFDIFHYDGSHFYVGFHGYSDPYGFRGIAKTPNFSPGSWIAGDTSKGVPNDSVFDKYDGDQWRENWQAGGIGGGAGKIYKESDYFYHVIELGDISLNCIPNQNWDTGIYRTTDLRSTNWDPFPDGNPITYSSKWPEPSLGGKTAPCNPTYFGIFKDNTTGKIFMNYTLTLQTDYNGMFIYELKKTNNYLKNANFWKCNSEDWGRISPNSNTTNMSVYRYHHLSSDATCFLATNCGDGGCQPGQAIYQDAYVDQRTTNNFIYGGKFAVYPNQKTGTANLDLFEFDSSNTAIAHHTKTINLTSDYQTFQKDISLKSSTKKVRYTFYLNSSRNFRLDETFVKPNTDPPASVTPIPSSTPKLHDLDLDNDIDYLDLTKFMTFFQSNNSAADINADGLINIFDLSFIFAHLYDQ